MCLQQAFCGSGGRRTHTLSLASAHSHLDGGRFLGEPRQRAEHAAPDEQVRHRGARAGDGRRVVQQLKLPLGGGASLAGGDRVDDRLDVLLDESEIPYLIEINTVPGLTETSLIPKIAKAAGISFEKFVELSLNRATLDRDRQFD